MIEKRGKIILFLIIFLVIFLESCSNNLANLAIDTSNSFSYIDENETIDWTGATNNFDKVSNITWTDNSINVNDSYSLGKRFNNNPSILTFGEGHFNGSGNITFRFRYKFASTNTSLFGKIKVVLDGEPIDLNYSSFENDISSSDYGFNFLPVGNNTPHFENISFLVTGDFTHSISLSASFKGASIISYSEFHVFDFFFGSINATYSSNNILMGSLTGEIIDSKVFFNVINNNLEEYAFVGIKNVDSWFYGDGTKELSLEVPEISISSIEYQFIAIFKLKIKLPEIKVFDENYNLLSFFQFTNYLNQVDDLITFNFNIDTLNFSNNYSILIYLDGILLNDISLDEFSLSLTYGAHSVLITSFSNMEENDLFYESVEFIFYNYLSLDLLVNSDSLDVIHVINSLDYPFVINDNVSLDGILDPSKAIYSSTNKMEDLVRGTNESNLNIFLEIEKPGLFSFNYKVSGVKNDNSSSNAYCYMVIFLNEEIIYNTENIDNSNIPWSEFKIFLEHSGSYHFRISYKTYHSSTSFTIYDDAIYLSNLRFREKREFSVLSNLNDTYGGLVSLTSSAQSATMNDSVTFTIDFNMNNQSELAVCLVYDNIKNIIMEGDINNPLANKTPDTFEFSITNVYSDIDITFFVYPRSFLPTIALYADGEITELNSISEITVSSSVTLLGIYLGDSYTNANIKIYKYDSNNNLVIIYDGIPTSDAIPIIISKGEIFYFLSYQDNHYSSYHSITIFYDVSLDGLVLEESTSLINVVNDQINPFVKDVSYSGMTVYKSGGFENHQDSRDFQGIHVSIEILESSAFFTFSFKISTHVSRGTLYIGSELPDLSTSSIPSYPTSNLFFDKIIYTNALFPEPNKIHFSELKGDQNWKDIVIQLDMGYYDFYIGYLRLGSSNSNENYNLNAIYFAGFSILTSESYVYFDNSSNYYDLSVVNGSNMIIPGNMYFGGSFIHVAATPKEGYIILGFRLIGESIYLEYLGEEMSFTLTRDVTIEVVTGSWDSVAIIRLNSFLTLDDAFNSSNEGDTIILINNYTLDSDLVLPSGRTFLIPYDKNDKTGILRNGFNKDSEAILDIPLLYLTLTIPNGYKLNIYGTMYINGVTGRRATTNAPQDISGPYSRVILDGEIVILEGGVLEVFGLIEKGNLNTGLVTAKALSSLGETFIMVNWRGGTLASKVFFLGVFPYLEYSMIGILTCIKVEAKANYYGIVKAFAGGIYSRTRFSQFDEVKGLFKLDEENNGYAVISKETKRGSIPAYGNMSFLIVSSIIDIYGGAEEIGGDLVISGFSASTKNYLYPIDGDMVINLHSGVYKINHGLKLLPGAKLYIYEDAELIINETGTLISLSYINENIGTYKYPIDRGVAKIFLGGTLTINGTFGGAIYGFISGGKVIIGPNANLEGISRETYEMDGTTFDNKELFRLAIFPMNGYKSTFRINSFSGEEVDSTGVIESISKYLYLPEDVDITYYFIETLTVDYTITYHFFDDYLSYFWAGSSLFPTIYQVSSDSFYLYQFLDKKGFLFLGWYTDPFFFESIEFLSKGTFGDINLYAKFIFKDIDVHLESSDYLFEEGVLEKTFDEKLASIYVRDNIELSNRNDFLSYNNIYSINYFWYKKNMNTYEPILGNTLSSMSFVDVSSSGYYRVILTIYYFDNYFSIGSDNIFEIELFFEIIINKKVIYDDSYNIMPVEVSYDNNYHEINLINLPSYFTYKYSTINNILASSGELGSIDVCNYNIKVFYELNNTSNYRLDDDNTILILETYLIIKPIFVEVLWSIDKNPYSNNNYLEIEYHKDVIHELEAKIILFGNDIKLYVTGANNLKDAGVYYIESNLIVSTNNYYLINNEYELDINKANIDARFEGEEYLVYDGLPHSLSIYNQDILLDNSILVAFSYDGGKTYETPSNVFRTISFINSGIYDIKAKFISCNYLLDDIETHLLIDKANLNITWPTSIYYYVGESINQNWNEINNYGVFKFIDELNFEIGENIISIMFIPNDKTNYNILYKNDLIVNLIQLKVYVIDDSGSISFDVLYASSFVLNIEPLARVGYSAVFDTYEIFDIKSDIYVYAIYSVIDYNIIYHLDDGSGFGLNTYNVLNEYMFFTPEKLGYNFIGWFLDESFSKEILSTINYYVNLEVYAKWEIKNYEIKLTYSEMLGDVLIRINGDIFSTGTINHFDYLSIEINPFEGFKLGNIIFNNEYFDSLINYQVESDINIEVIFTEIFYLNYQINYYLEALNDNSYELCSTTHLLAEENSIITTKTVREFDGFTYDDTNVNNVTSILLNSDNMSLKVYYIRNTYKVTYYLDNLFFKETSYKYEELVDLNIHNPKIGFDFVGYFNNFDEKIDSLFTPSFDLSIYGKYDLIIPDLIINDGIELITNITYFDTLTINLSSNHLLPVEYFIYFNNELISNEDSITLTKVSDTGLYRFKVSVSSDGFLKYSEFSKEIIIEKFVFDTSIFTFSSKVFTYDGTPKSVSLEGDVPNYIQVSYSCINSYVDAGIYYVSVNFLYDSLNILLINEFREMTLTISKRNIMARFIIPENMIYNKEEKKISYELIGLIEGDDLYLHLENETNINASNYLLKVLGMGGTSLNNYLYVGESTFNYIIYKSEITNVYLEQNKVFVYDKKVHSIGVNTIISLYNDELNVSYYVLSGSPIYAGICEVKAIVSGTNYLQLEIFSSFVIEKREVTIQIESYEVIYGTIQTSFSYNVLNIISSDILDFSTYREEGNDIGSYIIKGTLNSSANYYIKDIIFGTYVIKPKQITINLNKQTFTYSGEVPLLNNNSFQTDGILEGDELNINLYTPSSPKNAGVYEIMASYYNPNYLVSFVNGVLVINKKEIMINFMDSNIDITYSGSLYEFNYNISGLVGEDKIEVLFSNLNILNVGQYIISILGINSNNYFYNLTNETLSINVIPYYIKVIIDDKISEWDELDVLTYRLVNRDDIDITNNIPDSYCLDLKLIVNETSYLPSKIVIDFFSLFSNSNYEIDYVEEINYGSYTFTSKRILVGLEETNFRYDGTIKDLIFTYDSDIQGIFSILVFKDSKSVDFIRDAGNYLVKVSIDNDNYLKYHLVDNSGSKVLERVFECMVEKLDVSNQIEIINQTTYYNGLPFNNFEIYFASGLSFSYYLEKEIILNAGIYTIKIIVDDLNGCGEFTFNFEVLKGENKKPINVGLSSFLVDYHEFSVDLNDIYEFRLESTTEYSENRKLGGLVNGTSYPVYIRYKETANYLPSSDKVIFIKTLDYDTFYSDIDLFINYSSINSESFSKINEIYRILYGTSDLLRSEKLVEYLDKLDIIVLNYNAYVESVISESLGYVSSLIGISKVSIELMFLFSLFVKIFIKKIFIII
ncbi:MAG: InlB B-repeat-containing protein [Acholeplasmatales bacterium]|jgi:uncharacterized repeat protein (TIGR02543 family)|nr:InlB B-repeat-containing protein [Acholeplasmatales bacterium]